MATLTTSYQKLGEVSLGSWGYGTLYLRLYGKYDSQNIATNQTTYSLQTRIYCAGSYCSSRNCYANIDGTNIQNNTSLKFETNSELTLGSKTITVTHSDDGTKSETKSATFRCYALPTEKSVSATFTLPTINRYLKISLNERNKTINTISINWSTDVARDHTRYSLNGGAWTDAGDTVAFNNKSGYFTISDLEPNTTYTVKLQIKRKDNQLWSESSTITIKTYDYAKITSAPDVTIGNSATIKYNNPSGAKIEVGLYKTDGNTMIANYRAATGSSYTFNFTADEINRMYQQIPNTTSIILRFYLVTTQNGKSYYNRVEKTFSINLNTNKPTFSNFTYQDVDTKTVPLTGNNQIAVNLLSDIKATISTANKAVGKNYATILKYRFKIGNTTKEVPYSGSNEVAATFTNVTASVITVTAIDSRGLETSVQKSMQWKNYGNPEFIRLKINREGGIGTKAFFELKGSFWGTSFGKIVNEICYLWFQYRKKGDSAFSSWIQITDFISQSGGQFVNKSGSFLPSVGNGTTALEFELGKNYEIRFIIKDKTDIEHYSSIITLNSGIPCTAKVKKSDEYYSIGINKIPDENYALDVGGTIRVEGLKTLFDNKNREAMTFKGRATDFNTALATGFYQVIGGVSNGPYTGDVYGYLEVWVSDATAWNRTDNWIWQKFHDTSGREYSRFAVNGSAWTYWVRHINGPELVDITSAFTINSANASITKTYPSVIHKYGNIIHAKLYLTLTEGKTGVLDAINVGNLNEYKPKNSVVGLCFFGTENYTGWTFNVPPGQVNINAEGAITVRNYTQTTNAKKYIGIDLMYMV